MLLFYFSEAPDKNWKSIALSLNDASVQNTPCEVNNLCDHLLELPNDSLAQLREVLFHSENSEIKDGCESTDVHNQLRSFAFDEVPISDQVKVEIPADGETVMCNLVSLVNHFDSVGDENMRLEVDSCDNNLKQTRRRGRPRRIKMISFGESNADPSQLSLHHKLKQKHNGTGE